MSLVELVLFILILGVIISFAVPALSNISDQSNQVRDRKNAQQIAQLSSAVAAVGVAHVLPESLGGVEATARLLREGLQVQVGPMSGKQFILPALTNEQISRAANYLDIVYGTHEIRLEYQPPVE